MFGKEGGHNNNNNRGSEDGETDCGSSSGLW